MANEQLQNGTVVYGPWINGDGSTWKYRQFITYIFGNGDENGENLDTKSYLDWQFGLQVKTTKGNGLHGLANIDVEFIDYINNQEVSVLNSHWNTSTIKNDKSQTITRYGQIRRQVYTKDKANQVLKIQINDLQFTEGDFSFDFVIPLKTHYTIFYNTNNGDLPSWTDTKWYGEDYIISSTALTRKGCTFNGWYLNSMGIGQNYAGTTYTTNADLTLYVGWLVQIGTITYDANGGSGAPNPQTKSYIQSLNLRTDIPVKSGYVFMGWKDSETDILYMPGQLIPIDTGDTVTSLNLYAQWENMFNVTFEFGNSGSDGDNITNTPNISQWQYNTPMTFLNTNPIRYYIETSNAYYALYKLSRWYDKDTGITVTAENVMPGRDITIVAEWQKADLLEAQNATAVRAEKDSQTGQYEPNDTGIDCILTVSFQRPKYYSYSRTINGDNETIGEGVLTSAPVEITGSAKSVISNTETTVYEINEIDSSDNSSKDIEIHDSSNPPTYFDTDIFYNFSIDLDSRLGENNNTLILNGNNLHLTEFLSRAAFTIDISADGERIGIFKPILDTGTEKQIELNGDLIIENENSQNITLNRNGAITANNIQVSTINSTIVNSTTVNSITVNSTTINGVNNLNSGTAGTITIDSITATTIDTDELSVDTTLQADTINADNISASSLVTDLLTVSSSPTQTTIDDTGIKTTNLTADNIGTYLHDEEEIIITTANINTSFAGPSIQLSPGTWFISGSVNFTTASGTTERNAQATLYSGSTQYAMTDMLRRTRIKSPDNGYMALPLSYVLVNTQTLWITLAGSSDKLPGSATTNREGYLQAVRIK